MSIWTDILKSVVGDGIGNNVVDYFKKKAEIKAAKELRKLELEEATHKRQVELRLQGMTADATWELESLKAHTSGWKDELVIVLLAIPLVLVFIPKTAPYVMEGFRILETTPDWYRWLILLIFTAVYGIRIWRRQQSDT
jgi:hypothetical protein